MTATLPSVSQVFLETTILQLVYTQLIMNSRRLARRKLDPIRLPTRLGCFRYRLDGHNDIYYHVCQ